jgi:hypothetical protein
MSWNLEGSWVSGVYLETNHISGRVVESRVAYGGRVHHTVELDRPRSFFGTERTHVILKQEEITSVQPALDKCR